MVRKEELRILIAKLYKDIYDKLYYYKDHGFGEKLNVLYDVQKIQLNINSYIKEYESL